MVLRRVLGSFIMICGLGLFLLQGVLHEKVHQNVFKNYGINSRVEYLKSFPDFVTYGEENCPTNTTCELEHTIDDAIGYHIYPVFAFIIIIGVMILVYLEIITNQLENVRN